MGRSRSSVRSLSGPSVAAPVIFPVLTLTLTLTLSLALAHRAFASGEESSASMAGGDESSTASFEQVFRLGASIRSFDYLEEGVGGGDSERGVLPGLSLGYLVEPEGAPWFLSIGVDGLNGYTAYSGGSIDRSVQVTRPTSDSMIDAEVNAGLTLLRPDRSTRVELYTGIGYHYWRRGDAATVGGVGFFREDYDWWVLPVGMRIERDLGGRLTAALDVEGRFSFAGTLRAHLSQLSSDWSDASVGLGGEPGVRVSLPIELGLGHAIALVASPWFEYSAIGASDLFEVRLTDGSGSGVYRAEPASRTYQYGASACVALSI